MNTNWLASHVENRVSVTVGFNAYCFGIQLCKHVIWKLKAVEKENNILKQSKNMGWCSPGGSVVSCGKNKWV